jgi:hypothetical protein
MGHFGGITCVSHRVVIMLSHDDAGPVSHQMQSACFHGFCAHMQEIHLSAFAPRVACLLHANVLVWFDQ